MTIMTKYPATCTACRGAVAIGTAVEWERGTRGVRHADPALCVRQAATPAPAPRADGQPIAAFLTAAKARVETARREAGKFTAYFPRVHFLAPEGGGRELALHMAGEGSKYPGAIQVKVDGEWVGRIEVDGRVAGRRLAEDAALLAALATIAADPAKAATAYGMLSGRCSFCALKLTDEGSLEVGYGARCAKNYGLPHRHKGTPEAFKK